RRHSTTPSVTGSTRRASRARTTRMRPGRTLAAWVARGEKGDHDEELAHPPGGDDDVPGGGGARARRAGERGAALGGGVRRSPERRAGLHAGQRRLRA